MIHNMYQLQFIFNLSTLSGMCDIGYYLNGGTCDKCAVGSYKEAVGSGACTDCQTGATTQSDGSTSASQCNYMLFYYPIVMILHPFNILTCHHIFLSQTAKFISRTVIQKKFVSITISINYNLSSTCPLFQACVILDII